MSTPLEALQETLAAEHAAVWLYAALGGRVPTEDAPELRVTLTAAYDAHRARRDLLVRLVRDAGEEPVAAAASYVAPAPLDTVEQVLTAAQQAETAAATTYAAWVASSVGEGRRTATAALRDAAVRVVGLGGAPATYPGQ